MNEVAGMWWIYVILSIAVILFVIVLFVYDRLKTKRDLLEHEAFQQWLKEEYQKAELEKVNKKK